MKIIRNWMDPDTRSLSYIRYLPGWTWDEHHKLVQADTHLPPSEHPSPYTYVIVDWRGTRLPMKGSISAQYRKLPDNALVVIVLTDLFTQTMVHMGIKLRGDPKFVTCRTIEEAETIINRHRVEHNLPPLELINWVNQQQTAKEV